MIAFARLAQADEPGVNVAGGKQWRPVACTSCLPVDAPRTDARPPAGGSLAARSRRLDTSYGMTKVWQVQVAAPSEEAALALARTAVEARLAAGGQVVGPLTSVFWHQGQFGTGEEWQAILKTTEDRYEQLERHLVEHHEWSNPEITAVPIAAGLAPYLDWVDRTTRN